jgi:hypothetical protein
MVVVDLPLHLADPVERLQALHDQMDRQKRSVQTSIGTRLFPLVDLVPSWLVRHGAPPILHRQPLVNLAVTNLPGAREQVYLLGARMLEVHPFITVTGNLAMIIGVLSYADDLGVSITIDSDAVDDVDVLAAAFEPALRQLVQAVQDDGKHRSPAPQMNAQP